MAFRAVMSRRVTNQSSDIRARWMSTWWGNLEPTVKDPILGITKAFLADPSPSKVNVGVVSSLNFHS
ncbi:hypothetical protein ACJW31_08G160200 [Castanea mollissima]